MTSRGYDPRQSPGLGYKRVVSCKDSFHGTDVLAVRNTALRDGPEHPRALRRSPKGGRPRYSAGPRRRGKPKHFSSRTPLPAPENVAAKRCASEKRAF